MAALKVFLADDQIPNSDLFTKESDAITTTLTQKHPQWAREYINGFPRMKKVVEQLSTAYELDWRTTFETARDAILSPTFEADIAVIDLGWSGDKTAPAPASTAGFRLLACLEEINKKRAVRIKAVVYSNRIDQDPSIVRDAADLGVLAIKKTFDVQEDVNLIKAAIRLAAGDQPAPGRILESAMNRAEDRLNEVRQSVLKQQQALFRVNTIYGGAILLLLIIGCVWSFFGSVPIGLVSTAAGILSAAAATYFGRQLQVLRKDVRELETSISQELERLRRNLMTAIQPQISKNMASDNNVAQGTSGHNPTTSGS